ncbi:hypothetical protein CCACVL1_13351 [Corchorus capsularis]|uniref:Uncharacterized protein n=1 Tax=Corchorus capsularis TaxID=210143 RepID=A0A1R3IBD7_COCAP|nr:hypothetical protein CCACVL1_13351 [Corchorus capsularis]
MALGQTISKASAARWSAKQ